MKAFLRIGLISSITCFYGFVLFHLIIANLETFAFRLEHDHSIIILERIFMASFFGIWIFALSLWKLDPKLRNKGITFGAIALLLGILMPTVC
jgi:hypothetical protein